MTEPEAWKEIESLGFKEVRLVCLIDRPTDYVMKWTAVAMRGFGRHDHYATGRTQADALSRLVDKLAIYKKDKTG